VSTPNPTCKVIKSGNRFQGKQALNYFSGVSAENTGAHGICMHMVIIPPNGRANTHLHESHETAIYVIKGKAGMWYGENLSEHLEVEAGEFLYIPAGMPHQPYNPSQTDDAIAVLARTDPNEQESVVLLPELDSIHQ